MHDVTSVVITGASGGIGQELAKVYAAPGVTLGLVAREAARLEPVAEACRAAGAEVEIGALDIRDRDAVHAWLAGFDARHPVDLLIANAGVSCGLGPGRSREADLDAERLAEINYKGTVHSVSGIVDAMCARGSGRIALIASLAGMRALPDMPSYSATKAAIIAYGEALRGWLRPRGISVTVICPGFVTSPMSARHRGGKPFEMPADKAARIMRRAIDRRVAFRAFPWPLVLGIRLAKLLPPRLSDLAYRPFMASVDKDPRSEI